MEILLTIAILTCCQALSLATAALALRLFFLALSRLQTSGR
jgi:hypothetical protein